MKQTAVEWLVKEANLLENNGWILPLINQAKEMEKQQIIEGYQNGSIDTLKDELKFGKQYYNEQFKNK
jgi:hypothetical protein